MCDGDGAEQNKNNQQSNKWHLNDNDNDDRFEPHLPLEIVRSITKRPIRHDFENRFEFPVCLLAL